MEILLYRIGNVNRLSKVYLRRNTLKSKRVEYIKCETHLVEVQGFL